MEKKIAVLFGPEGGNTERVARLVADKIGAVNCTLIPVSKANEKTLTEYSNIIIGSSTIGAHNWSIPNSSKDWDEFLPTFRKIDFTGKTVALFGLGDHLAYPNNFVDGMRIIYDILLENNAKLIGKCSTEGYEFHESQALVDGEFVGLPIDEDYEEEFTDERIEKWLGTFIDKM
jgi:flavodoxin I